MTRIGIQNVSSIHGIFRNLVQIGLIDSIISRVVDDVRNRRSCTKPY